jgi:hypothetical protein
MRVFICFIPLLLSACAVIEPESVRIVGTHVSSISQHFGSNPTDYGYQTVGLEVHWEQGRVFEEISDGINLNSRDCKVGWSEYGSLVGPREVFEAKVGMKIWRKQP